jgi:hypothetical protein
MASSQCASPTSFFVDVYSEVPCTTNAAVLLRGGSRLEELPARAPSAGSTNCTPVDGGYHRGNVVLVPSRASDEPVAFEVVTRTDGESPETDCAEGRDVSKCIVARRQLRFVSKATQRMRIDLRLSCAGIRCAPTETCVRGGCVPAESPCTGFVCDESILQSSSPAPSGSSPLSPPRPDGPLGGLQACDSPPIDLGTGISPAVSGFTTEFWVTWVDPSIVAPTPNIKLSRFQRTGALLGTTTLGAKAVVIPPTARILIGSGAPVATLGVAEGDSMAFYLLVAGGSDPLSMPRVSFVPASLQGVLAVHGLPRVGNTVGVGYGEGVAVRMARLHATNLTVTPNSFTSPGTWITTAATVDRLGYSWREGTDCKFATFAEDGTQVAATRTIATSCFDSYVAAAGTGWKIAYHTSTSPKRIMYLALDADGNQVGASTTLSPPTGEYVSAQVVTLDSRRSFVLYRESGTNTLFASRVDDQGKIVDAAPRELTRDATQAQLDGFGDRVGIVMRTAAGKILFRTVCDQ